MTIQLSPLETLEIPRSKLKIILLLIGSVLFVAAGIWFVKHPESFHRSPILLSIVGYMAILFFGVCALFIVNMLFNGGPGFVIDAYGIVDNSSAFSVGFIPWEDITGLSIIQIGRQKLIMVKVADAEGYINRQTNALGRRAASINYKLYGSPVSVSTVTLTYKLQDLYNKINDGWRQSGVADRY